MKKITLLFLVLVAFCWQSNAQFTESFDTEIPAAWTVLNEDGGTYTWDHQTQYPQAGAGHVRIHWEGAAHDDYLISPQFTVTAGTSDRLSFYAGIDGTFWTETFEVRISTTGTTAADFTNTIASETATTDADGDYTQYSYDISAYVGQDIYVAIVATDTNRFYLYVDEFTVDTPPSCLPVSDLMADVISATSANLSWTMGGSETLWDIEIVDITAAETATGTPTTSGVTNPYAQMGLTLGNDYEFYVRADCGGGDISTWVGPFEWAQVLPPTNDECVDAIALTVNADLACTITTSGTIEAATASGEDEATCGGTENDDVWFSFVATAEAHVIDLVNTANGTTDLYHSVWSGSCGALTNLNCSDPNTSSVSGLTIGDTYLLRVYSWTATAGQTTTFDVCIGTPPDAPDNDECADAIALTVNADLSCSATTSGTIASATASGEDEASCFGTEDDDVWFSFVATGDTHTIDLVNVANGTTDLYHSVWEGTCGSLTLVPDSCSDPNSSSVSGLTMGNIYLLRVYSWTETAGQTTTFDVCIGTPPPPSTNTSCATADAIECGETLSGNSAASTGTAEDSGCIMGDNGLWYTFTGTGFDVTLASTASFDHRMAISIGACGTLANVVCDDQSTGEESHTFTTVDGEIYYVYIAHYNGGNTSTGTIGLTLTCAGPANDECDGAEAITLGEGVMADNTGATNSQVPADCFTGTIRDLWYSFTATATGEAYISTSASQYALYSDCTGTQEGACNTSPISGLIEGNMYYVRINDDGAGRAPGAFDLIVSDVVLSTNEFDNPGYFTYYPNPVKNTLTLNAQNTIENVTMYNMLGQEVLRATPNAIDSDLDMSNLQTGTYFVKVTIANITETIRVIKQ